MAQGKISSKQQEILDYIKSQILERGFPPAVRDICEAVHQMCIRDRSIPKNELSTRYELFGGYEYAERQMVAFLPDALCYEYEYPIDVLRLSLIHIFMEYYYGITDPDELITGTANEVTVSSHSCLLYTSNEKP